MSNNPYAGPVEVDRHLEKSKTQPNLDENRIAKQATTSLILGFMAIAAWILPVIGLPLTIVGLVKGIQGVKSTRPGQAMAGIVMNAVFLALTLANSILGALMMM